jgi:hypothetical protein
MDIEELDIEEMDIEELDIEEIPPSNVIKEIYSKMEEIFFIKFFGVHLRFDSTFL